MYLAPDLLSTSSYSSFTGVVTAYVYDMAPGGHRISSCNVIWPSVKRREGTSMWLLTCFARPGKLLLCFIMFPWPN